MVKVNINEKIILVTGATDGIGKETAKRLAARGSKVILHSRSRQRGMPVLEEIREKTQNNSLELVTADFSSLQQVRKMAESVKKIADRIDVLINNAGVYMNERRISKDGFEMTLAINHLAHFLLTGLLLDLVKKSSQGRIINVASMAHASNIDLNNLQGEIHFDGYSAYAQSKLINIIFSFELANRLKDTPVTVNCLHPGVIATKLLHAGFGFGGASVLQGSENSVFLASSQELAKVNGHFFVGLLPANPASISNEQSLRKKIWEASETLTGFRFESL